LRLFCCMEESCMGPETVLEENKMEIQSAQDCSVWSWLESHGLASLVLLQILQT
jgi:hypothetical protein